MVPHQISLTEIEQAATALREFYLRCHRTLDRQMTAEGASYARTKMLLHIGREQPLRSTDIALTFGYAPRTVTEAIDGMERDGLVRREPDPDDRRAKRISLTAEGEIALQAAEAARRRFVETVFNALDAGECGDLIRLVGKLNLRLDAMNPPE